MGSVDFGSYYICIFIAMIYLNSFLEYETDFIIKRGDHALLEFTNSNPGQFIQFNFTHSSSFDTSLHWDWNFQSIESPIYTITNRHFLDNRLISKNSVRQIDSKHSGALSTLYQLLDKQTRQWKFQVLKPIQSWFLHSVRATISYYPNVLSSYAPSFSFSIPVVWNTDETLQTIRCYCCKYRCLIYTNDTKTLSQNLKGSCIEDVSIGDGVIIYSKKGDFGKKFDFDLGDGYDFLIQRVKIEIILDWNQQLLVNSVKQDKPEELVVNKVVKKDDPVYFTQDFMVRENLPELDELPIFTWVRYVRNIKNREQFYKSLLSIQQQKFDGWEIIICDDGLTVPLLYDYPWIQSMFGSRMRVLSHPLGDYKGITYWFNRSLQYVRSRNVIFVLDDIIYDSSFLMDNINNYKSNTVVSYPNFYRELDYYIRGDETTSIVPVDFLSEKEVFDNDFDDCMSEYLTEYFRKFIVPKSYCFREDKKDYKRTVQLDWYVLRKPVERVEWEWNSVDIEPEYSVCLGQGYGFLRVYDGITWSYVNCEKSLVREWWEREGSRVGNRVFEVYLDWDGGWFPSLSRVPVIDYLRERLYYHPYFMVKRLIGREQDNYGWKRDKKNGVVLSLGENEELGKLEDGRFWERFFGLIPRDWRRVEFGSVSTEHQVWREGSQESNFYVEREGGLRDYVWGERVRL